MDDLKAKRKVAFYIRVSTERQAKVEEGSLKNQKQILHTELERRNLQDKDWGTFVEAYIDEGISGKNTNRPAFKRMMTDLEIGRIDTVMFTELSRLSRSLKDFLNIFEFAQKHQCDLVCLKTDIDTTSPYKSLITKILMVFAEFEREMTSRRTSQNAYERSKRGLANGGVTLLGYKRDKKRKGYLFVDTKESKIVQEIFTTYPKEKSIKKTTDSIKTEYEGQSPRLKNITRSKIYSILINKAYIGIREIYKRDGTGSEEVSAVWDAIVAEDVFNKVQTILQKNRDRYHSRGSQRYNYLFSGLLRCGKCGEKLQGKCAYSSSDNKHYYYSHKSNCPKGGITRIDAETVHTLVLDWLRDLSENGEWFQRLKEQGKKQIDVRIAFLQESLNKLETETKGIDAEIENRIRELTKTNSDIIRQTIEKSVIKFEELKKENEEKRLCVNQTIQELKTLLLNDENLFTDYSSRVREVLDLQPTNMEDGSIRLPENQKMAPETLKNAFKDLLASLILEERAIKIALSSVNKKALCSSVFAFAPPVRLELTT